MKNKDFKAGAFINALELNNPKNDKYITPNSTVWLNSGSDPFIIKAVFEDGNAYAFNALNHRNYIIPIKSLTPEPKPFQND